MRITPARRRVVITLAVAGLGALGLAVPAAATAAPHTAGSAITYNCTRDPSASPRQKICFSVEIPTAAGGSARTPDEAATPTGYSPASLHAAYAVPTSTASANSGRHPTVALVDAYGDPTLRPDLDRYRSRFGLPACTVGNHCLKLVNEDGHASPLPHKPPTRSIGWNDETALDVDMVSAMCPYCHILVVQTDTDDSTGNLDLEIGAQTAARLGAKYVSMSWGTPDFKDEKYLDAAFEKRGVDYVASSGDGGYGANWPAASTRVTSVGGTRLQHKSDGSRSWTESVWDDSFGETSAGCSKYEGQPGWQRGVVPTSVCRKRAVADVSAIASPENGVASYSRGAWRGRAGVGGTSASAPLIAALYALAGTPNTYSNPAYGLYAHGEGAFNDVVLNSSTGHCVDDPYCAATDGWDPPTGLGTPDGLAGFTPTARSHVTIHHAASHSGWVGQRPRLRFRGSDGAGLGLHYAARGLPAGLSLTDTGVTEGRVGAPGRYHVVITAFDATGGHASTTFTWLMREHRLVASHHPRVHGVRRVGHTVHVAIGGFHVDSRHGRHVHGFLRIHWYANGHRIKHAHHKKLTLKPSLVGKHLSVRVTAVRSYFRAYHKRVHAGRVHY